MMLQRRAELPSRAGDKSRSGSTSRHAVVPIAAYPETAGLELEEINPEDA